MGARAPERPWLYPRFSGDRRGQFLPRRRRVVAVNPVERVIRKIDAIQQRFTPTAFVFGVVKKYGDDNGGVLVSNLAYSSFVSMFPLLLVLVTILGLASAVDASFRQDVLNAVASQAPVLGKQLTGKVHELKRSRIIGVIVG